MNLVKTSLLSFAAVAAKLSCGLALNKVLAVYLGPSGLTVVGQFQNLLSILTSLAGGLLANGVTKQTAELCGNQKLQSVIWQTAVRTSLLVAFLLALLVAIGCYWLATSLLGDAKMISPLLWVALALPAIALNNVLMAAANGKKDLGVFVTSSVITSFIGLSATGIMTVFAGLEGALMAIAISPIIATAVTVWILSKRDWFSLQKMWGRIDLRSLKALLGFGLAAAISAISAPVSFIAVREHLIENFGSLSAGYWQATWRLSEMYVSVITTVLSVYFLPRLAEIRAKHEIFDEIKRIYILVLPTTAAIALTIFVFRSEFVSILFSSEFSPMQEMMTWQLFGDVIKVSSWILGYGLIARGMISSFVSLEIFTAAMFALLTNMLSRSFGVESATIAYAVTYSIYWILLALTMRSYLRVRSG